MAKHFYGLTDTGRTRDNNEDNFIVKTLGTPQQVLAAVIDGVGGYHGGEVAAELAKDEILKVFAKTPKDIIQHMIDAFKAASKVIFSRRQSDKELAEMACVATLVYADIEQNQFFYAHVGDTRLYLLRDGSLIKITKDHSFVGFLEDSGRLSEEAAMKHPKRNEINKALGFNDQISTDDSYIETGQSPFLPGDLLLLCSDGLTDMVDKGDITHILQQADTLTSKATNLVALANENGGRDNITVVLLQNDKKQQKIEYTKSEGQAKINPAPSQEKIVPEPITPHQPAPATAPKRNFGFTALVILCVVLLGATILLYFQNQKPREKALVPAVKPVRNNQEILLQDALTHAVGDTLVLSDTIFKSPIILTDTLRITKDSLRVFAKGLVLQADTGYKGAALAIGDQCKFTTIDSLQFKGFKTAIALKNTAIYLSNVSFVNCALPVQNHYYFPAQQPVNAQFYAVGSIVVPNVIPSNPKLKP